MSANWYKWRVAKVNAGLRLDCKRRTITALLAGLLVLFSVTAAAQRVIVTTTTLTATREAARVYLQSVDMGVGAALPGPDILPGGALAGPLLLACDGGAVFLSTGTARRDSMSHAAAYASKCYTAPFRHAAALTFAYGWREWLACTTEEPSAVITLGSGPDATGAITDRLHAYRCDLQHGFPPLTPASGWDLPGRPVDAAALPSGKRIAVLCQSPLDTGSVLREVNVLTGEAVADDRQILDENTLLGGTPSAIAVDRSGAFLFVLTSGYAADRPSGDLFSWLHILDASTGEEACAPVQIPGAAQSEDRPLHPAGSSACWVATRTPGADFAYVTRIRVNGSRAAVEIQTPLTAVANSIQLAPAPISSALAVGIDNRLEIWPDGRRGALAETYEAPIGIVRWTPEGLFAGAAGCLHQVDPATCATLKTVPLQSGWITDLVVVPRETLPQPDTDADAFTDDEELRLGTSPTSPDTDADGIPDGSDPEPTVPSPRLQIPGEIFFHAGAVGYEIKAFRIVSAHAERSMWQVTYDQAAMPWLKIHPLTDNVPGVIYMGIDPGRYAPGSAASGKLAVRLTGATPDKEAAGSPATVEVRVLPEERASLRRILWIWSAGAEKDPLRSDADPRRLGALAGLLAAPPLSFTHREATAPFQESLDPYTIVVLHAAAAAEGAITRQTLIEYVAGGGALLFLGEHLPNRETTELSHWLAPAGIQIDTSVRVDGVFAASGPHELGRYWNRFPIADGCAIYTEEPNAMVAPGAPGTEQAVFLVRSYGRGRIAALASAAPIESPALKHEENRLFAADLFRWLAQAATGAQEQDMDGDGLPDSIEDRNGNGQIDPGETDYLDPDTDQDGIPDGMEDANLNGRVDDGETNPLNPDSNGNGILDGADPVPVPPAGTPVVARVVAGNDRSEGPAEGGYVALVSGRNFAPNAAVWFGSRLSPAIRVLRPTTAIVEVPPYEGSETGEVPVKVVNLGENLDGVLPAAFRYTPRTKVALRLETQNVAWTKDRRYEGSVSLRLEVPPNVTPDRIILLLKADPHDGFAWKDPAMGTPPDPETRQTVCRPTSGGDLLVVVLGRKHSGPLSGSLGTVAWSLSRPKEPPVKVRISAEHLQVTIPNGQALDTSATDAEVGLPANDHIPSS